MFATHFTPRAMFHGLLAAAAVTLIAATLTTTMPAMAVETTHLRLTQASFGGTQNLSLDVNKSVLIDLPADVKEVIVSQPAVAPTIMRTKRRAIVQGGSAGATNIFFLDGNGRTISVINVTVQVPPSDITRSLEVMLRRVIPGSNIRVESITTPEDNKTHFLLTGTVFNAQDKAVAEAMAADLSDDDQATSSLIEVLGPQQVALKVTVAEVQRDALREFGINLSGSLSIGNVNLGFNSQQASGSNGIAGSFNAPNISIDASLRALERRGAVHSLAEPTLTAMSGQPAEFLVGGEFPVTVRDNNGTPTTTFKQFGVNLNFTPVIRSNGQILLAVDTSVSEPTNGGGITQRSAKTTVELGAGETLSIAGIFQDQVRQQIQQMPGLGDIPILGALFRSREFVRNRTELVILVTPCLAEPGRPVLPTDKTEIASDAEAIFLGRMENMYGVGHRQGELRAGYNGSVGFILD